MNFKKEYSHENIPEDVYKAIPNHASKYEKWLEKASESLQDFMYCMDRYYKDINTNKEFYADNYLEGLISSPYFTKDVKESMKIDTELIEAFAVKAPINALLSLDYASKISQKERDSLSIDLYCGCGNAFRYNREMKEGEWLNFKDAFKEKGIEIKDEDKEKFDEYCKKPSSHKFNDVKSFEDRVIQYTEKEIANYAENNGIELTAEELETLTNKSMESQDELKFPKSYDIDELMNVSFMNSLERE